MNSIGVLVFLVVLNGLYFSTTSNRQQQKKLTGQCMPGTCCRVQDGRDGKNSLNGRDGLNGQPGRDGTKGHEGKKGQTGPKGEQGVHGTKGDKGDTGSQGSMGPRGVKGEPGKRGLTGQKGDEGLNGSCDKTLLDNALKKLKVKLATQFAKMVAVDVLRCTLSLSKPLGPLGMNSYVIKDIQVTASSVYKENDAGYGAHRARLNYKDWNGWAAKTLDANQWLQIRFSKKTVVTDVATQSYRGYDEWVTTYQLSFSNNGRIWSLYEERGHVKTFAGNTDRQTVVKHKLQNPVETFFIRFLPKTWKNHISMRIEVYGCYF